MAKLRVAQALVWLSGSTNARGRDELARLVGWPIVHLPLVWFVAGWLELHARGEVARALGLRIEADRGVLLSVALAGVSVATVGTVGFVGLIAPHLARLLGGVHHRELVPLASLLGATLVVVADTLGRIVVAPKGIPSGLVTAMIGAPFFVWLLWWSRSRFRDEPPLSPRSPVTPPTSRLACWNE